MDDKYYFNLIYLSPFEIWKQTKMPCTDVLCSKHDTSSQHVCLFLLPNDETMVTILCSNVIWSQFVKMHDSSTHLLSICIIVSKNRKLFVSKDVVWVLPT